MKNNKTLFIVQAGIIAALYVVLTLFAQGFDLASGAIQCRFSEALTILPFFTPAAIPGVTIGCLLSNIFMGNPLPDVVFGTLATLIGCIGTYALRKHRFLCSVPPVISNALIIPFVLKYAYGMTDLVPFMMLTVGAGEVITCMIFGEILLNALYPVRQLIFADDHYVLPIKKASSN
ncbi:MAG: QueT transporter family protein [Butyrivibrio sp.]|uniref:QueT transporter family protein n=1 Tax=Butyrivibrio sp. TaxID=28121 RepID=UPI0025E5B8C0|nr:QueT transporter family protein [Butyrivibrio sp.]MCR5772861.1 QueT transporter family protein [Butyrivibrio sp.]